MRCSNARASGLALAITRGFGDALRIGTQARPDIFARHIVLPEQLPARVIEIDERVAADGEALLPLDEKQARAQFAALREDGFDAIAIVLMHGWQHRDHEERLAAIARELGFRQVSVSHEVAPLIRLIPRGDTTVVDAYLSPVLRRYTDNAPGELARNAHIALHAVERRAGARSARFAARTRSFRVRPAAWSAWSQRARRSATVN